MEPEFKPEDKFPKKRVALWIISGLVIFGGANALAFSNGYKNFVSDLKVATIKSWEDISNKDDEFKLVATIPLDSKEPLKEERIIVVPKPKKTISENIKEIATSIQSIPEKMASIIISTSSNLLIPPATSPKTEPIPPPLAGQAQNEILEPEVPIKEEPKQLSNVLISVVQITGGKGKSENDFIILFNPNEKALDISGWNLRRKNTKGDDGSIKVFESESIIPAYGSFIWANSANSFHLSVNSNTWSSATISENYSIALWSAIPSKGGKIIDSLAWGEGHANPYIEGSAVPNPEPGILIKRKFVGEVPIDTNDNSQDFLVK